ncbi:unnamed protein product [Thlaspi arvense]|uniref:non-specific serine/threonine protein kinase n=1 Tax=Thlaspi arvense TaxID=13288 RepID=A0AAU9RTK0_THLAR|nr:unnamed protein product [Thlaspi arvense]
MLEPPHVKLSLNRLFLPYFLVLLVLSGFISPQTLPKREVDALRAIAKTLKKSNWDFSVDPCDTNLTEGGWRDVNADRDFKDAVTCGHCSTVCHVTSISLKGQSFQGFLPREFAELPFLQEIDLSRNYLNGSIPPEWGSLPLVNISLLGNRISGQIPKEIGNITTLLSLVLDNNQISGKLPPELGNLPNVLRLFVSSNYLSGDIPSTFSNLTTLTDFRISDNQFNGTIPDFIQNWTELGKLVIQASGLVGPIPSTIATLKSLRDLRISDLRGPGSPFPPLQNMTSMKLLILGNCNLTGELPAYLGQMKSLKLLDLSFNKLTGPIPVTYSALSNVDNIYFTSNMLNGEVPSWMVDKGEQIDLAYNNFIKDTRTAECMLSDVNMFSSTSPLVANNHSNGSCLSNYKCIKTFYGLHINCGGDKVTINKIQYDADASDKNFYDSRNGWVYSNTGRFVDDDRALKGPLRANTSELKTTDYRLYTHARLSANSLTYYALCLRNVNYTVNLHFSEIMFSDDNTYSSLGRRFFDIYIQGKLEIKDFNIVDDAKGAGRAVVKSFSVMITNGKLEIRLIWAGKGTQALPVRGVYGPLISAVSVDPDFTPPKEPGAETAGGSSVRTSSVGTVVGAVVASMVFLVLLIGGILWWRGCCRPKSQIEKDFKNLDFQISSFSLRQIKVATNNFDPANKIGEGGFGPVHKVHVLREQNKLMEVVDPRLGTDYNREEAMTMIQIGILCTSQLPSDRPSMSTVVSMLEGHSTVDVEKLLEALFNRGSEKDEESMRAMKKHYAMITNTTDQTTNAGDLYPVKLDSCLLEHYIRS